jgi:hypothetical protein
VVALIILVIHLAVQQLKTNRNAGVLGDFLHAIQPGHAIFQTLGVGLSAAIAGKRDHVGHAGCFRARDVLAKLTLERGVIFGAVQAIGNRAGAGRHGWHEAVFLHSGPVG